MQKYILLLLCVVLTTTTNILASSLITSRWDGWKFNVNAGMFGILHKMEPLEDKRIGASLEVGFEYGHTFGAKKQFYVGGNILFNACIPDSFTLKTITLLGKKTEVYPIFIPMFDILAGYNINKDSQFLIGSTYFWGLTFGYRTAISDTMYVSFKGIWWIDRIMFKTGLHDVSATVGIGYQF
jgi:hypothetical protein